MERSFGKSTEESKLRDIELFVYGRKYVLVVTERSVRTQPVTIAFGEDSQNEISV